MSASPVAPYFITHFAAVSRAQRSREDIRDEDVTAESTIAPSSFSTPLSLPSGTYSHLTYVKIYATCRLRRIWLSDSAPGVGVPSPWEFELYGD
ncbi:hypothetical protein ID866_5159 [Astraeus odoratus]|nr:hypothetical protein ID866_5159 [Astraeus odoratus]